MNEKGRLNYDCLTTNEEVFFSEVLDMERNTVWTSVEKTSMLEVCGIPKDTDLEELSYDTYLDPALLREICESRDATHTLIKVNGELFPVAPTAMGSLAETAKISGSALSKVSPEERAMIWNIGLKVASGGSIIPIRYDMAAAIHSDGYQPMPISELLDISLEELQARFGRINLAAGYNSAAMTRAIWTMPDAEESIRAKYRQEIGSRSKLFSTSEIQPVAVFQSSDVQMSCATLKPEFRIGNSIIPLPGGAQVKHIKSNDISLFRSNLKELYAILDRNIDRLASLSQVYIRYGANCVVSLCKRYHIPKMWGDLAREEIESFQRCGNQVTALDIYLSLSAAIGRAEKGETLKTNIYLEEAVSRILTAKWAQHDIGGVVAWDAKAV